MRKHSNKEENKKFKEIQKKNNDKTVYKADLVNNNHFCNIDQTETSFNQHQSIMLHTGNDNSSQDENSSSDSDDLHKGVSIQDRQKRQSQGKKSRDSKASDNKKDNESKGFFRNSVLVQKTINFFGRKNKISLNHAESANAKEDHENSADNDEAKLTGIKSSSKPDIVDYFVQTNQQERQDSDDDIFEKAKDEVNIENDHLNSHDNGGEADEEAKEETSLKQNKAPLPLLKPRKVSNISNIKKLCKPPIPKNSNRNSEVKKFVLDDLIKSDGK